MKTAVEALLAKAARSRRAAALLGEQPGVSGRTTDGIPGIARFRASSQTCRTRR
jgi:hypothetical protein